MWRQTVHSHPETGGRSRGWALEEERKLPTPQRVRAVSLGNERRRRAGQGAEVRARGGVCRLGGSMHHLKLTFFLNFWPCWIFVSRGYLGLP